MKTKNKKPKVKQEILSIIHDGSKQYTEFIQTHWLID